MALLPGGGYSQKVNVNYQFCMKVPDEMDLDVACAIPEAFLTAYQDGIAK